MAISVAACLVVLLAIFEVGSGLNCYQCNSQSDKKCGDPFVAGSIQTVNCAEDKATTYNQNFLYNILPAEAFGSIPGSQKYCHKVVMASKTVIRTCLDGTLTNMAHSCDILIKNSKLSTPDKKIESCIMCDKDNCNGASSLSFSLPLAAVTLAATYLLYKQ